MIRCDPKGFIAEVAVPRELFRAILEGIQRLRLPTPMPD
jgi:hypothetical protein